MKTLIETYRGWEIYFDTDTEEFYTLSNEYDTDKTKKTYSAAIKYIDDYIKDNYKFTPFMVQKMPSEYHDNKPVKIIGIRKDMAFMYEDRKGNKKQLSKYDEDMYFKVNPSNEYIFEQMEQIEENIKRLRNEVKELQSKVIVEKLSDIKTELKPNI